MSKKRISMRLVLSAFLLGALGLTLVAPGLGFIQAADDGSPAGDLPRPSASPLSPAMQEAVVTALAEGEESSLVHIATQPGQAQAVARRAVALGAEVVEILDGMDYLTVRFSLRRIPALAEVDGVLGLSLENRFRTGGNSDGDAQSSGPDSNARADEPKQPTDPNAPANFEANRLALRAADFTSQTAADGRGVVIAVIDTGVDPSHPDLKATSAGNPKVIDWQDFSGEGDVDTLRAERASGGRLATPWGTMIVPSGISRSGMLHVGILREASLANGELGRDLNRNGQTGDEFGVLVTDATKAGLYDTVYVDTNSNHRFDDEKPLRIYSASRSQGVFGNPSGDHVSFVVTRIYPDGNSVNLGFDGNGHGTHVAAVAAGNSQTSKGMRGIAPGASLMVLKALDSAGDGGWDNISRAMVYAAQNGAQIISMSIEGSTDHSGQSPEAQLMARLSRRYNVLFIVAAGNGGPGIGSAGFPGSPADVVSVGASMTPELWNRYYGLAIPRDSLLEFSAAGPRRDGTMGPTVVAPGVAVSAVPVWANPTGYDFKWGTSMAVPHVAGAAASLLSAARSRGVAPSYRGLKSAIEEGAKPLKDYQIVEQGFGRVDLPSAWGAMLKQGSLVERPGPDVIVQAMAPGQATEGLDARSFKPGWIPFVVQNPETPDLRFFWRSTAGWAVPQRESLSVPGKGARVLPVAFDPPQEKGLHSALIRGFPVATYSPDPTAGPEGQLGPSVDLLSTLVVPYEFSLANNWQVNLPGAVEVAQYRRFFFQVPEGAGRLDLALSLWRGVAGRPTGRVEVFLFRPDGRLLQDSDIVGDGAASSSYQVSVDTPMSGAWEAVVFTPADYAAEDRFLSLFQISASLQGVLFPDGPVRLSIPVGQSDVSLTVPALNRDEPFTGSVVGVGLAQPIVETAPELVTLREGEITTRDLPYVPAGTSLLRLSLTNPTRLGGRVNFSLYHKDEKTGSWRIVTPPGAAAGTQESLDLPDPEPGQYVVSFIGSGLPGGQATYEYRQVLLPAGEGIRTADTSRVHSPAERWQVQTRLTPPPQAGRYFGRLIARDENGRTIGYVPVEVSRGQPTVKVRLLPQTLARGEAGWVTLDFRDEMGRLVSPLVTLNGAVYQPRGGQISLRVGPSDTDVSLRVAIIDPAFAYAEQALVQPLALTPLPKDALGPLGTGQDFDWRYQKLLNEMGEATQ